MSIKMNLAKEVAKTLDVLIDWSGHSKEKIDVKNIADFRSYEDEAIRLFNTLTTSELEACKRGTAKIILPGFSQLSAVILAAFHGKFGGFPRVYWYIRNAETGLFTISESFLDLQAIRYNARKYFR